MCDSDKIMAEVLASPSHPQANTLTVVYPIQFVSGRVYEMRAQMNAGKLGDSDKMPLLQRLLQHQTSTNELMADNDIISECMGHM